MLELDHIAVAARTLAEGAAFVEAALGVAPGPGGRHATMGTHNLLLGLGPDTYLEVIAIDPEAPPPGRPRWFGLDDFSGPPRLTNWILRATDLGAALAAAPVGTGRAEALARGDFRWRMAVPDSGHLPFDDIFPALLEWQGGLKPQDLLPDSGLRLTRLEVAHPRATALGGLLGLADPRVVFVTGNPGLGAAFSTPGGLRQL